MLKLIIEDDEGHKTVVPFVRDELTIGRQEGNTIRLTERNVSRRHARLVRTNGHVIIEDLGSYNGIRLNGEKVMGHAPVHHGDLIQIGDYDLALQEEAAANAAREAAASDSDLTPPHGYAFPGSNGATGPESELGSADEGTAEDPREQATAIIRVDQLRPPAVEVPPEEIPPSESPRLVAINTELAGRTFAVTRTEARIGRTGENDVAIDHRSLSRTHAKLVRDGMGEWKIVDLGSANGLTVNGERYAQTSLSHLDTIELGHLQLRFVAPGQTYAYDPPGRAGTSPRPPRGKSPKVALFAGLGVGALAVVGVSMWASSGGETADHAPGVEASASARATSATAPSQDARVELATARAAMAAKDFRRAVAALEPVVSSAGSTGGSVDEARALLADARDELEYASLLDRAEKSIQDKRLTDAVELLGDSEPTRAWKDRHQQLVEALTGALEARQEPARPVASAKHVKPASGATQQPQRTSAEQAQKLHDEGLSLFQKGQYEKARASFTRCIEVNREHARCHMMLGSTAARLGDKETGARHYEMFIRLDPSDREAPNVRKILEQYRNSKQGGQ